MYRPSWDRRDDMSKEQSCQIWDVDDEYHDDEDPGYRIREIYEAREWHVLVNVGSQDLPKNLCVGEAELLAELSQKLGSTKSETPAGASSKSLHARAFQASPRRQPMN